MISFFQSSLFSACIFLTFVSAWMKDAFQLSLLKRVSNALVMQLTFQLLVNFSHKLCDITRLNSEDFSKFFLCQDILFLTFSYESTYQEVQKNAKIFSIILEYSWFFRLFRGFSYKTFLYSELQLRAMKHQIPHKIPHRTVYVTSLEGVGGKRYHLFYRFYGGWKLRRFTQNQINLHQKVSQNHRMVINSKEVNFHEKTPTHISATYAFTIFYQNF